MKKVIVASGPVIVRDNKVLLDKSGDDDFWKFCGGRVEENNLELTATSRAKEELGIDVEIKNPVPFIMHVKKPGAEDTDVLLVHFLSDFKGQVSPGQGVKEWKWLDINNLPEDIAPNIISTLKYFGYINE